MNQNQKKKKKREQPFHYIKVMLDRIASFKWFWGNGRTLLRSFFIILLEMTTAVGSLNAGPAEQNRLKCFDTLRQYPEDEIRRSSARVCMCVHSGPCVSLLKTGVDAGDWVELGDAALGWGVKALGLAAHLEEDFLFLQLPGKLFLQGLRGEDKSTSVSIANAIPAKPGFYSAQRQRDDSPAKLLNVLRVLSTAAVAPFCSGPPTAESGLEVST